MFPFQVSGKLQCKACDERPDVEELKSLADSVNEFTTSLIDPLKSDKSSREAFSGSLDSIIDEAIQNKQMKVQTQSDNNEYVKFKNFVKMMISNLMRLNQRKL